jgi:phosphatidylserine decarboxylase
MNIKSKGQKSLPLHFKANFSRTGQWLPQDHRIHKQWLQDTVKHVDKNPKALHPVLEEFKEMIEKDVRLFMLFSSMFEQIPNKKQYLKNPAGERQIRDYQHMLQLMNHLLTTSPSWSDREFGAGVVGLPFFAIFDWPMGTPSGFAVFQDPNVNAKLKKVLHVWGEFLQTPESAKVLDNSSSGWFGESGYKDLQTAANSAAGTSHKFDDMFICDPSHKYHGFDSWDSFFTRHFKEGIRPIASPDNDSVVTNVCESKPYKVAHDVKAHERFWIKGQPYSVLAMLAHDSLADQFVGGTIYQAFLSALSYHRWHSPVSGKIVKQYVVDGTYFSEPPFSSFEAEGGGENVGQEYLSAMAARGLIFIEADNPDIGLMCVIPIGMVEVSTVDITVKEGQHVKKGDELGMVSNS